MMRIPSIRTQRLELASLSPAFIDALLSNRQLMAEGIGGFPLPYGWPDGRDAKLLKMRLDQMHDDPGSQEWLLRAMISGEGPRQMVGHIGFHGPPAEGSAELGYTVFARFRRRGYALESARAMMDWAQSEHDVAKFVLSISPENEASLAMAEKMGFARVGEQMDEEDGLEWVFELISTFPLILSDDKPLCGHERR